MTEAYVFGSMAKDDQLDILWKRCQASDAKYDTFENELAVKYQVPADHEFIITKVFLSGSVATQNMQVGYADDAITNDTGPPTNYKGFINPFYLLVADKQYEFDVFLRVPTGKYPVIKGVGGTMRLHCVGYERSTA